jgi:hypothetical protein
MGGLHMDVFELAREQLLKHLYAFVALVILCDILFRVEVRKLGMLRTPHEHWADDHLDPRHRSIPALTTKRGLYKVLLAKDVVPDYLFIVSIYHSVTHLFSPGLFLNAFSFRLL